MMSSEKKTQGKPNVQKNTVFAITRRDDEYYMNIYGFLDPRIKSEQIKNFSYQLTLVKFIEQHFTKAIGLYSITENYVFLIDDYYMKKYKIWN